MPKRLSRDACGLLLKASAALERAARGARDAAPSLSRSQDDDLANAVFAEMAAAEHLMRRATEQSS